MIYIRADYNSNIGMGHIMRCLSIADALCSVYEKARFIVAGGDNTSVITDRGYETYILNTDYRELDREVTIWPDELADLIIVDSYYVSVSYFDALKKKLKKNGKLVYVDDLGLFPYPVDVLINYNAYGPFIDYLSLYDGGKHPEFLLGPVYAPLRAMFRNLPEKDQKKDVRDILVSTGGSDIIHLTLDFLKAGPVKFNYHLLLGKLNPDIEEIKKIATGKLNIHIHENVTDMRSLITSCDIAVSAAGSTLYEICACGVPLITYICADNQIRGADAFEKSGLAVNCGDMRRTPFPGKTLLDSIDKLASDYDLRYEMGRKMQRLIDGYGAYRLVKRILS